MRALCLNDDSTWILCETRASSVHARGGTSVALDQVRTGRDAPESISTSISWHLEGRALGLRGERMQPSMFNVQVPIAGRNEVFLMNTFSDAQLLVAPDVAALLERAREPTTVFTEDEMEALDSLAGNGFLVSSRDSERRSLDEYFRSVRDDRDELRVTVLTTLQCNFACDYCSQGDHGDDKLFARKMSHDMARQVAAWIEQKLDAVRPSTFALTFFGGEPLLNLPVTYFLSERCHQLAEARGIKLIVNIITNGLLLTPEVVD